MRKLYWIFLVSFICLLSGCKSEAKASAPESVSIAVATDLHYLAPSLTDGGEMFQKSIRNGDGKVMLYIEEITDSVFGNMCYIRFDTGFYFSAYFRCVSFFAILICRKLYFQEVFP